MPQTSHSLTLLMPGYNEEANVEEAIQRCLRVLPDLVARYEVIIVDDGSTDRTPELADRLAQESPFVRVIHNPVNLSVGISLLIGMKAASCDLVLHNAMDYPFDLADLDRILPLFPEWDVVVVARTNREAHSAYRKLTSLVNYWLIRLLFRAPFGDMNFVQVYKREVLQALRVKAKSPAFVTPELLIRAREHGFKITEVEAVFHRRHKGKASFGKPRDILWTLADMLSFWLERRTVQA
jgi:glycosyltransferase involved in cell wall biosynthesis